MGEQSSRSGDHNVGPGFQALPLLLVGMPVCSAVDRHAADREEIGESLHLLVDLLGELAGGSHDHAIDSVFRIVISGEYVDYGQKVGRCLARAGLRAGKKVAAVEHRRYGLLLDWGAVIEMHVP